MMSTVNERIVNIKNIILANEKAVLTLRGLLMGAMLIAIFLHLLNTELTSAPEFIYNQF